MLAVRCSDQKGILTVKDFTNPGQGIAQSNRVLVRHADKVRSPRIAIATAPVRYELAMTVRSVVRDYSKHRRFIAVDQFPRDMQEVGRAVESNCGMTIDRALHEQRLKFNDLL